MGALPLLLDDPTIASKRWVYQQYDSTVQAETVLGPGGDAGVLRIPGTSAGLAVSVWIFRNAAGILVENLGYLTGRAAAPEVVEQIYAAARHVDGVEGVHRVIADYVGPQVRAELRRECDHAARPFCAPRAVGPTIV